MSGDILHDAVEYFLMMIDKALTMSSRFSYDDQEAALLSILRHQLFPPFCACSKSKHGMIN